MSRKVNKVIGVASFVLAAIIITGIVILYLALNSIVAEGIRTFGTQATGTKVEIQNVAISPFGGSVELKGMYVANPQDCHVKNAFGFGRFYVSMDIKSVFSNKIVINDIIIEDISVDFEPSLSKGSNLHEIKNNIMKYCAAGKTAETGSRGAEDKKAEPGKKESKTVAIKHFIIKNGKISVASSLVKTGVDIPMPVIEMRDIGTGESKSSGEVFQEVYEQMLKGIGTAVSGIQGIKLDNVSKATESVGEDLKESFKSIKSSIGL